jgi:hypothetical protein
VADGERPLKFELDITASFRNLNSFIDSYPICFKGLSEQKKLIKLDPDKANSSGREGRKAAGLFRE